MRKFSTADPKEKECAVWAVQQVQRWGGVLEHPEHSTLWQYCHLPSPALPHKSPEGWSLSVPQYWFGHRAEKMTWLYLVGIAPNDLPLILFQLGEAEYVVRNSARTRKKVLGKTERQLTPAPFAVWLVDIAQKISKGEHYGARLYSASETPNREETSTIASGAADVAVARTRG
jgi:hypothetical protein